MTGLTGFILCVERLLSHCINPVSFVKVQFAMKSSNYLIFSLFLFCIFGCQGANVPGDFPKTFPVTITVKDGATPLADTTILLYGQGTRGSWASSGNTDANGVAELVTNQGSYMAKGVPEGSYKVTLSKTPKAPSERSDDEIAAMSYDEQIVYSQKINAELARIPPPIPRVLTNPQETPLTLEVTTSSGELLIDLSPYK